MGATLPLLMAKPKYLSTSTAFIFLQIMVSIGKHKDF